MSAGQPAALKMHWKTSTQDSLEGDQSVERHQGVQRFRGRGPTIRIVRLQLSLACPWMPHYQVVEVRYASPKGLL